MEFSIISEDKPFTHVKLSGRLDTGGVDAVEAEFVAATAASAKSAVVDMSEVDFMASMGIRMLVAAAKTLAGKGAKLVLLNPHEFVDETMKNADLYMLIPVAYSEDEAVTLLGLG